MNVNHCKCLSNILLTSEGKNYFYDRRNDFNIYLNETCIALLFKTKGRDHRGVKTRVNGSHSEVKLEKEV